jgi:hypothetical protein
MGTRAVRALVAALALVCAGLVAGTANADPGVGTGTPSSTPRSTTTTYGNYRCTYYANASGFGTWCGGANGRTGTPPTWRQRLRQEDGWPFIPCRNYDIPPGVILPDPPEGKRWTLRVWIRDYDLDAVNGGPDVHLEHEIVAVTQEEFDQCRDRAYMESFWKFFYKAYPTPILVVKPTYIPRVNSPAYFSLGLDTTRTPPEESGYTEVYNDLWNGHQRIAMQARVTLLKIDPDDGTPAFGCTDVTEYDEYDETKKPTEQTASCKHVFKRSSAHKPDGMYTLRISAFWQVRYCLWTGSACDWRDLGTWEVKSIQKLPVQEVQGIGGGR